MSNFLDEMKQILLAEKARLETALSQFAHRNPKNIETDFEADFPEYGDNEDENAAEIATYTTNLSLENELEKALRDVESAIQRIEDGTYLTCKYCKSPIDEARLRARPTSTTCIACKKTLTQEM